MKLAEVLSFLMNQVVNVLCLLTVILLFLVSSVLSRKEDERRWKETHKGCDYEEWKQFRRSDSKNDS